MISGYCAEQNEYGWADCGSSELATLYPSVDREFELAKLDSKNDFSMLGAAQHGLGDPESMMGHQWVKNSVRRLELIELAVSHFVTLCEPAT